MFTGLFRTRTKTAVSGTDAVPAVPAGTVAWSVGDIHGRLDLLLPLIEAIVTDLHASTATQKLVIFLGDYIDRGPDSRGVLQLLAGLSGAQHVEWRFLKGNHEQAMIEFLDDPATGARWCEYGGDRALQSWGLRVPQLAHRTEAWATVAADLRHRLTRAELQFLESLQTSTTVGDYFFCHAGARPGVALDRQSPGDLMWIRQPFLESRVAFERVVVHGHTPTTEAYADQRRIGIDTKAYDSGVLTALRLEGTDRSLLQSVGARRAPGARDGGEEYRPQDGTGGVLRAEALAPLGS